MYMCICTTESGRISCCIIRVHLVSKSYRSLLFVINKMANTLNCRGFLLLTVFATLCTEIISKYACEGDSVQIFQNITSARFKKTFTLYKTGAGKQEVMAFGFLNDSYVEVKVQDRYLPKVSFENGSIMLGNIKSTDYATYALVYDHNLSTKIETNISTLVPPTSPCKPKIRQDENVLFAFLDNSQYCGDPQVSVQWMEYPGISYKDSKAVIEVPSGKDPCTYYACIQGEALTCTRKSAEREYCEHITIGSTRIETTKKPSSDTDTQQLQAHVFVITILVALILIVVIVSPVILLWKYDHRVGHRNVPDPEPDHDDNNPENVPLQDNMQMEEIH